MTLLEPLWLLWVDVPLALLAGLLLWSVLHMDPVPATVDIMTHPGVRAFTPITRQEVWGPGPYGGIQGMTASSAFFIVEDPIHGGR